MAEEELKELILSVAAESRASFAETRLHFDIVAEGLRHEIQLVAEGLTMVNEKLEDMASNREMRREFSEVRSLMHAVFSQHDRRLTKLENA